MKTERQYCEWMDSFMDSWKNLDGIETTRLLSKDVQYFETPMGQPCPHWKDVEALWVVVASNQRNIQYKYSVVSFNEIYCVFNWQMTREFLVNGEWKHQSIDGIFQVALDEKNKCCFFKQWRYTEVK